MEVNQLGSVPDAVGNQTFWRGTPRNLYSGGMINMGSTLPLYWVVKQRVPGVSSCPEKEGMHPIFLGQKTFRRVSLRL